jgi:hypothetical protein
MPRQALLDAPGVLHHIMIREVLGRKGRTHCSRKWVAINRIRFCYFFTSVPISFSGSNWEVSQITFRVVAKEKDGSIRWDRKFKESIYIGPLSTTTFSVTVVDAEEVHSVDWHIEEVLGFENDE